MNWYPLYNVSLSLYAKAGGTPWLVDESYFNIADCYIGQAFSILRKNNKNKFFVGAADVFNSYGEYISFALHQGNVENTIKGLNVNRKFMRELLFKSVMRYEDKMGSPNSILIHRSNKFNQYEIEGIKDILKKKKINTCYLVHVQNNNLYRCYDSSLKEQVRRGTYLKISPGQIILIPTGYLESEKKYQKLGTPKPVVLNIIKIKNKENITHEINNEEINIICKNYLAFTRLRWNSLSTRLREPITLFASRKIANWQREGFTNLEGINIRDIL